MFILMQPSQKLVVFEWKAQRNPSDHFREISSIWRCISLSSAGVAFAAKAPQVGCRHGAPTTRYPADAPEIVEPCKRKLTLGANINILATLT